MGILSVSPSRVALQILTLIRRVGAAMVFLWGWFILASFRTQQFGEAGRSLLMYVLAGTVWVFLPAILVFLQRDFVTTLWRALALTLVAVLAAMAWANVEEMLVVSTFNNTCMARSYGCTSLTGAAADASAGLVYNRAWPFQQHSISYSPIYGWQGND